MGNLIAYLDTHAIVWSIENAQKKVAAKARRAMERADEVRVSPAVLLELHLLREIGRVNLRADEYVEVLSEAFPFHVCDLAFANVVLAAAALTWTRDPFDRIIVAQALVGGGTLVTQDAKIRRFFPDTVWD